MLKLRQSVNASTSDILKKIDGVLLEHLIESKTYDFLSACMGTVGWSIRRQERIPDTTGNLIVQLEHPIKSKTYDFISTHISTIRRHLMFDVYQTYE